MFEGMRQLIRDDIQWSVREASGALVPGARGTHCLIFDGESIVRRVWVYPVGWDELSDDELWALLGPKLGPSMPPPARGGTRPKNDPAMELAAETVARTKSLLAEITLLREAHRSLHRETRELISDCRARRAEMQHCVESYAAAMRLQGLAPEEALVLIKGAVTEGLGPVRANEDPDAETMVRDAVAWGIAAYYAA
ncbi:MAG: hypothetical protein JWM41_3258 [Gemmatimonadetes bacterium]|nr:hypothetical protein [Gemmatimonadota bacterium]